MSRPCLSTRLVLGAFSLTIALLAACRATPTSSADADWFVDRARETGLDYTHINGMSGEFYAAEIFGPGVALFDYDNDGDLDVFVLQGHALGPEGLKARGSGLTTDPALTPRGPLGARLFRNDLMVNADGTRNLRFTDVTAASGIVAQGYGMGAATGDFDNDGCTDLYVTNFGLNQMFRNNCDGTFTDRSGATGTADSGWSVSASFFDYDRDGWLDLFVGHYLNYTIETDIRCVGLAGSRDYCAPTSYRPQQSRLFHNNGNGTFADVTTAALPSGDFGPALGVVAADLNGDGWIDFYVANDGQPNQIWINQHDGTFKNTGLLSGGALNPDGRATASMGIDAGDFDNDGDDDVVHANLTGEGSTLLANDGRGTFEHQTGRRGLGAPTLPYTGFGTAWLDFDNDGWLDLITVNGAVRVIEALARAQDPFPLHQQKQIFHSLRGERFEEVSGQAGASFRLSEVGRGAAFGDIDNDGDVDVLVGNNNGPLRLLVNTVGSRNRWIGLRLIGTQWARDMVGARAGIVLGDGRTIWRRARADGSFASANDPRVLVGLGESTTIQKVRVVWPDSRNEEWSGVPIERYTTLKEGTGK